MEKSFQKILVLLGFLLFFTGERVSAQMGLTPISAEEYESLPKWVPDSEGVGEFYQLDLRPYLPKPGSQGSQNSCTGWAVAYAVKSYLEVRDQKWKLNNKARIFSPAFVYNQINGGKDKGSSILSALRLLVDKGCATLATMPYTDRDYQQIPSAAAFEEAKKFKCKSFATLKTGQEIRLALRQGHLVIVSIRTDPIFNSGAYKVFKVQDRRRGEQARGNFLKHGYHAMVIVGYDDARQAFLFMNSWGSRWGQGGFCWVSYDLVKKVRPDTNHFVQGAYILLDVKRKIGAPIEGPINKQVSALAQSSYMGFSEGTQRWACRAWLNSSYEALKNVKQVVWYLPAAGNKTASYLRRNADDSFMLHFTTLGSGKLTVNGTVTFSDNSQKNISCLIHLKKPIAEKRNLKLVQTDQYWGLSNKKPYWKWTLRLQGSLTDLADVVQVTYHLHPSFNNPNRVVRGNSSNGFAFVTLGWGTFQVKATVFFKDGTKVVLAKKLAFKDKIRNQLQLVNYARPSDTNQKNYDWTAYIDGPLAQKDQIQFVEYFLHPTFNPNRIKIFEGSDYGFPLSRTGWGVFLLKARVHFKNGSVIELQHQLQFKNAPQSPKFHSGWR